MKRRKRVDDARDESAPAERFDHSSQHSDLQSLIEEHSYGAGAEAAMQAWLESRKRPDGDGDGAAEPPTRAQAELQRVLHTLESVDADRVERAIAVARPETAPAPPRVATPAS